MSDATVELTDLVGLHMLTGIDFRQERVETWQDSGHFEDCHLVNFTLDGVTYTAIEDPEDGYRSSLSKLIVSNEPTTNQFPPLQVLATIRAKTQSGNGHAEVLQLFDCNTGKLVLEVGTDDNDDYYPSFVAAYWPENMAFNKTP